MFVILSHNFLEDLALILSVAAITTVVFQRLRLPLVLGYLIAGIVVGPYTPLIRVEPQRVQMVSELGVILLIFSIGLEFRIGKLVQLAPTAGFITIVQVSVMLWVGYAVGEMLGWTELERLYTGAIIAISSTTIVAKVFAERQVERHLHDTVFGVLLFEDLVAILLLAILTALSSGKGLTAATLFHTAGRLGLFLAALIAAGILIVPRLIRSVARFGSDETLLVSAIGVCFASALAAEKFDYSVALGAFLAGSLVAESGVGRRVEHLAQPLRDIFGAIFFVSVGMMVDPRLVPVHWKAIAILTAAIIVGKTVGVAIAAFLVGEGVRRSLQAGLSLAQIGEFSFIIAGAGLQMGAVRGFLYTLAVAVSVVTTFTTPFLIQVAEHTAAFIEEHLPRKLRVFTTLYTSWIENLRTESEGTGAWRDIRGPLIWIVSDTAMLVAVVITLSVNDEEFLLSLEKLTGLTVWTSEGLLAAIALAIATPLYFSIVLSARRLGLRLAGHGIRIARRATDAASAPRRLVATMLQIAVVLAVTLFILAVTQPFLPPFDDDALMGIAVGLVAIAAWRGASKLQVQLHESVTRFAAMFAADDPPAETDPGQALGQLVTSLGTVAGLRLEPGSFGSGKTLRELNLRAATGATVLAVMRDSEQVLTPAGNFVLRTGDTLTLAGTGEAVAAARALLAGVKPMSTSAAT